MNTVKKIKIELEQVLADAVSERAAQVIREKQAELMDLRKALMDFENDPFNEKRASIGFDESGFLVSRIDLDLSALSGEEFEVIDEVINLIGGGAFCFGQDQYSQGKHQWFAEICLGEVTIFDPSPDRHRFAIYSEEIGLKISSVIDEEHGLALIEQAHRKAGIFPSVVKVDCHGNFSGFWSLSAFGQMSDEELSKLIDTKEGKQVE